VIRVRHVEPRDADQWIALRARELGCSEFASDTLAENGPSLEAHRARGFEEVEVIRCFRKSLAPAGAAASSES
jgi:hypothetical protein